MVDPKAPTYYPPQLNFVNGQTAARSFRLLKGLRQSLTEALYERATNPVPLPYPISPDGMAVQNAILNGSHTLIPTSAGINLSPSTQLKT